MRLVGYVARMGERRVVYGLLVRETWGERNDLEDPEVDGWIILNEILKKWKGSEWTGLILFRIGTVGRLL